MVPIPQQSSTQNASDTFAQRLMGEGQYVHEISDSEVEQWVLRELQLRTDINSRELCVFCLRGVATLSGTVKSNREKPAAVKATELAMGVRAVIDNIKVNEIAQTTVTRPSSKATSGISTLPDRSHWTALNFS